jgi:putative tricarboxylic transport membrane protein
MLENLATGFVLVAQWQNALAIIGGAVVGYFVGALPGLSAGMGIALLLPFCRRSRLVLLTSCWRREYGDSITAVLINVPGKGCRPTTFDGYPRRSRVFEQGAGASIVASCYAGIASTIGLMLVSFRWRNCSKLCPPEYFALSFGLTTVAGRRASPDQGPSVLFGLLITTIGVDAVSGNSRYIFFKSLYEGIPLIPVMVGLFAVSEVFLTMEELAGGHVVIQKFSGSLPTIREYLGTHMAMLRGTLIGFIIGIVPGAGKAVASFIAYNERSGPQASGALRIRVLEGVAARSGQQRRRGRGAGPAAFLGIPARPPPPS